MYAVYLTKGNSSMFNETILNPFYKFNQADGPKL